MTITSRLGLLLLGGLLLAQGLPAQTGGQEITLEHIWQEYRFYPRSVPGFNFMKDGQHYSRQEEGQIVEYDITDGGRTRSILDAAAVGVADMDGYSFSGDERKILLQSGTEAVYRRSFKASYHVWDSATGQALALAGGAKVGYATFSPDGSRVAYTRDNDLYVTDLATGEEQRLSHDGAANRIINGSADWVYEEEFSFAKAFFWSPDGQKIAYLRFDESAVPEFTMMYYNDGMYPEPYTFKYPKVGEKNAVPSVHIHDLGTGRSVKADIGAETDLYIPRLTWTQDANTLCITRMNRHQNVLELLLADAATGQSRLLLREESPYYIDVTDNLSFLKDGKHFIWTSEQDGFNHIYLYDLKGKRVRQITKGDWEVTAFYGIDEADDMLYYQSTEVSPMERHVYRIGLNGKGKTALSTAKGMNQAQFSSTFDYMVLTHSTANQPASYAVYAVPGQLLRLIEDNARLRQIQAEHAVQPVEFFQIRTSEDVLLNAWQIKPVGFVPTRQYPVLMFEYGGPGSQEVLDQWDAFNYWWFQMLAQKGYMVVCVDNRGTGGRGEAFKKMTYLQLGKYEAIDQIEAARWLAAQPYVDGSRIGIFGWSFGGYLSSLCILKGNDVFKAAIAVAPVTNWKWYDTIYTERYMRTTEENPEGYRDNSPVYFADRLKGHYLIVHGMADDNVHFQHTAEMVNALVKHNKAFDTYFYPNRNHGIFGGPTRLHLYRKMTDFLLEKL